MVDWKLYDKPTADITEGLKKGVLDSTLTVEELGTPKETSIISGLTGTENSGILKNIISKYFSTAKGATVFRENILRHAAYLYTKDQWAAGNKVYGYSKKAEVDAIEGMDNQVAHVARHLLGDYASLTEFTKWARNTIVPFGSFQEINLGRWPRGLINAVEEGRAAPFIAMMAAGTTFKIGYKIAYYAILAAAISAITKACNEVLFPEEERGLSIYDRNRPHFILGKNDDGSVRIIRRGQSFRGNHPL